jgi:hypothetical protein
MTNVRYGELIKRLKKQYFRLVKRINNLSADDPYLIKMEKRRDRLSSQIERLEGFSQQIS